MDAQQRQTLQSLLRITEKTPPQHRLEEIEVALKTRLGLYQQEQNKEGVALYQPLVELLSKVQSVEELQAQL